MKTLEDERYVVIKAYKCTVSEIWRWQQSISVCCYSTEGVVILPPLSGYYKI